MRWLAASACMLAAAVSAQTIVVDRTTANYSFDGIGGLSAGATSRLLVDYREPQRSQLLDYLFKPNFGASLHILKVEIGGDSQSTDGCESSHMHTKGEVDLKSGYEWFLMVEAKKRNPDIKLYSLPWAFPGWIENDPQTGKSSNSGSPYTYIPQTVDYIMQWVKGAKTEYGLDLDILGVWNERPSNAEYVIALRETLTAAGFAGTKLIAADGTASICDDLAKNASYAAAVELVGLHYPSDYAGNGNYSVCHGLGKPLWSSEESSSYDDYNGAACWARVIHSHFVLSGITSNTIWSLIGTYYHGTNWYASGMLTAVQPWSGYWETLEVLWATAHVTQFSKIGWKYLAVGAGSGVLPNGGYYTTMVDEAGSDFSIFVVKISHEHARCTRPSLPDEPVSKETVVFKLQNFTGVTSLAVRHSNYENDAKPQFELLDDIQVSADGTFSLTVDVGDYFTLSTIRTSSKGSYDPPASQPSFPLPHHDDFASYATSQEAMGCSDQIGVFEVHTDSANSSNQVMRQMVPQLPVGWADKGSQGPVSVIGMKEWQDVSVEVRFRLSEEVSSGCVATRANQMWGNAVAFCVGAGGGWNLTYGGPPEDGNYTAAPIATGTVPRSTGVWHTLKLATVNATATGWYDGQQAFQTSIRNADTGFAAIGTNGWHAVEFDYLRLEQVGDNWAPRAPCPMATPGALVSATPCQNNGLRSADQTFVITSDWNLVHTPSGLCVEVADAQSMDGSPLTMAPCNRTARVQQFYADYTLVRNQNQPFTVLGTALQMYGTLGGAVSVNSKPPPGPGLWSTWAYFPNTFQLRNTYDTNTELGYPMCLSACS
ncbi:putative galactocerebrosidase [Diplonema papillatum]|nr:putative galactocerebrosidase [Diplonema papillatum]